MADARLKVNVSKLRLLSLLQACVIAPDSSTKDNSTRHPLATRSTAAMTVPSITPLAGRLPAALATVLQQHGSTPGELDDGASAEVWGPAPTPRHMSLADHRVCVVPVVAELWSARGRGAALGRRRCWGAGVRPVPLGSSSPAASWRFRSRARPRPLPGLPGPLFFPTERDRLSCPSSSKPAVAGGISSTTGAKTKHLVLAACVGVVVGR